MSTPPEESEGALRAEIDLDRDWAFRRWPGRLAAAVGLGRTAETRVALPHCWNEHETFQYGRSYTKGLGVYRRSFRLPVDDAGAEGAWSLRAEGFYGLADVALNGRTRARKLDASYLGFDLPCGDALDPTGSNDLEIRVTNRCPSWVLPGTPKRDPDFVLYGGLAGHLRLVHRPLLRIDDGSLRIRIEDPLGRRPRIRLAARIVNGSGRPRQCRIRWTLRDAEGRVRARADGEPAEIPAGGSRDEEGHVDLEAPRLWSLDDPHLYRAVATVVDEDGAVDRCSLSFGLRTAEFRPDEGFFLNGERVELRGANRHQSMPGFGNALPDPFHDRDAELLKRTGVNLVRLAHYPQHPRFLDACDRLGLLVYPEIASWKSVRGGRWLRSARRQMRRLVLRDRHRPSIVLWGMGNESRHREAYLEMGRIVRELDPDRPVTYAENHLYRARRKRTVGLADVWGVNYELDVLEEARAAARLRTVLVSECMNHPRSVRGDWAEEETQLEALQRDREILRAADPSVAGFAIWAFADYATEHRARYRRLPGLYDAWRQPKMAAVLFRAWYSGEPVLEILGDWGERDDGAPGPRTIHVLTNCGDGELHLGGERVGAWETGEHHRFEIEPRPEGLEARGTWNGRRIEARRPWHGPARRIVLVPDAEVLSVAARETVGFGVRIQDAEGREVTAWNGDVRIRLEGPARLRAFTPEATVEVSRGTGRGFVTAGGEPGTVRLRAEGDGLEGAETTLRCEEGSVGTAASR